ncbi:MAG: 50S ribosomal protein L21 [Candidatus Cloacimonetes bacterium 4572_55]|nr:MAG: 50S ribosomal protein L21 [Candidatus Cloacimonetes bacterium 4572_55]
MYAIMMTGGLQYRVTKNDVIQVPRMNMEPGDDVEIGQVMLYASDTGQITVGKPMIEGAKVYAKVLDEARGKKLIVFKMKRRKKYRRKNGHRQWYTELLIKDIVPESDDQNMEPDSADDITVVV